MRSPIVHAKHACDLSKHKVTPRAQIVRLHTLVTIAYLYMCLSKPSQRLTSAVQRPSKNKCSALDLEPSHTFDIVMEKLRLVDHGALAPENSYSKSHALHEPGLTCAKHI